METRTVAFTANYSRTNSNFIIQNLPTSKGGISPEYQSLFAVLKNLLQRGAIAELSGGHTGSPTRLSHYLEDRIGDIANREDFKKSVFLIAKNPAVWHQTIKGDDEKRYYPAREFFNALPTLLDDYGFVQQLILPETPVHTIYPSAGPDFTHQQVDFYCPPAKLIIEIDGGHHKGIVKVKDDARDKAFSEIGILTVRIDTKDWREKTDAFEEAMAQIKNRLIEKASAFWAYKTAYERLTTTGFIEDDTRYKFLPTAIMRFQLLMMELLIGGQISLQDKHWHFVVQDSDGLSQQSELYARFASLAVGDLFAWLAPLCKLMRLPFKQPELEPIILTSELIYQPGAVHIDFSLLQRYTDEHIARPETMYVRTDYFVANKDLDGKNYFRVSTTKPINYALENTDEVKEMLQFFLQNLFRKNDFKEGQLPIILNALNRRDTIGLLPTGGGKSLCYQLPCLLQPAISVVVCPIKSLMYDQKDNLDKAFITRTNFMVGEQEAETKQAIQREFSEGRYFFIWISPERFQIKSFRTYLSELYARTPLAYAVIDEVHCMSEWGHDFRTSYLNLTKTLHEYCPETALIGLTATASLNVLRNIQIEFGRGNLAFDSENLKTKLNFSRPKLMFEVVNDKGSKADLLKTTLKKLNDNKELMHQEAGNKAGLIFTPFANGDFGCCQKSKRLNVAYQHKVNWYSATGRTVVKMPEAAFNNKEPFIGAVKATIGDRMNEYELNDLFGKRSQLNYSKCLGSMDVTIKQVPILSEKEFEAHKKGNVVNIMGKGEVFQNEREWLF